MFPDKRCDFCGVPHPTMEYDCGAIISQQAFVESGPAVTPELQYARIWMSCEACGSFLDRRDFEGLQERVLKTFAENPETAEMLSDPNGKKIVEEMLTSVYNQLASGPLHRIQ